MCIISCVTKYSKWRTCVSMRVKGRFDSWCQIEALRRQSGMPWFSLR
jgi:hypothetical protein